MTEQSRPGELLWQADQERINQSSLFHFTQKIRTTIDPQVVDFASLHRWSISEPGRFWEELANFVEIKWQRQPRSTLNYLNHHSPLTTAEWFAGGKLNFAENLLSGDGDQLAIIGTAEGCETIQMTRRELRRQVALYANVLRDFGVKKGDRVAAVIANIPEAIIAMLASASIGAIWSSCSPDFGANGIIDRFAQIQPKVLFFTEAYHYGTKYFSTLTTLEKVINQLPTLTTVISIDHLHRQKASKTFVCNQTLSTLLATQNLKGIEWADIANQKSFNIPDLIFEEMDFNDPLAILFSSGTTGVPKCIVHAVGRTLLQHKKELLLHTDLRKNDRLFYYTTCGWMMWNWMLSGLAVGATLVLYDGAVNTPDMNHLWNLIEDNQVTCFGTSPKFIASCMAQQLQPNSTHPFAQLRTILSTGSPLLPEHYRWIYQAVRSDLHLASISGGTDIVSCFVLGNPLNPVYCGEIQGPGLGMSVEVWDDEGKPCALGEKGELVCTAPFVAMPLGFWNDPDGVNYHRAYFEYFPNREVWRHGDYATRTKQGGFIIFGRSDATLNPGGIRIGTAEIYRMVEALDFVEDSIVCGVHRGGDVQVILFIQMKQPYTLDSKRLDQVKAKIRTGLSPRHVPHHIFAVDDIPYTRSGKKVELALQNVLEGKEVKNSGALKNPEVLQKYQEFRHFL